MISAKSEIPAYQTAYSDGTHTAVADSTVPDGGGDVGFCPHALLEASLATCINMTVRMYAQRKGIALRNVVTKVKLDGSNPAESVFRWDVELDGDMTEEQRARLMQIADRCPVRRALLKTIRIDRLPGTN